MSLPTNDDEERLNYPYFLLYDKEVLPFRTEEEVRKADQHISDFLEIVNLEKQKSTEFASKTADVYFDELLLMRPPEFG